MPLFAILHTLRMPMPCCRADADAPPLRLRHCYADAAYALMLLPRRQDADYAMLTRFAADMLR